MAADLGISLFVSTGILLFLATLTTVFRCIARIYVVKAFGLDDWLMVLTLVSPPSLTTVLRNLTGFQALFTHYSAWIFHGRSIDKGRPDNQIPISDVVPALKAFYFAELS